MRMSTGSSQVGCLSAGPKGVWKMSGEAIHAAAIASQKMDRGDLKSARRPAVIARRFRIAAPQATSRRRNGVGEAPLRAWAEHKTETIASAKVRTRGVKHIPTPAA